MEMLVAGALFLITLVPTPQSKINAVNSPSLQEIAKNVSTTKSSVSQITPTEAKSPTPTLSEKPKNTTHEVKSGETLNDIAENYYGSGKYWTSLWNDNPEIKDPRIINSGLELKIRKDEPTEVEDLKPDLQKIYDEITAPSPTPTSIPSTSTLGASTVIPVGPPSNFDSAYQGAGSRFNVPWQILYGIHMVETGLRDGNITSGYGTGAQGPMQFMPGTWAAYGVDGNGDGAVDINNAVDAIFGAANFIATHGGVDAGLRAYGGDSNGILNAARSRGYNQ